VDTVDNSAAAVEKQIKCAAVAALTHWIPDRSTGPDRSVLPIDLVRVQPGKSGFDGENEAA
jgi:hypothetical protein